MVNSRTFDITNGTACCQLHTLVHIEPPPLVFPGTKIYHQCNVCAIILFSLVSDTGELFVSAASEDKDGLSVFVLAQLSCNEILIRNIIK